MSQEALNSFAEQISAALLQCRVSAYVVVIPGDAVLYGTATILSDDLESGITALKQIEGVKVRHLHPRFGLVTFEYVPQQAQV